MSLHAGFAATVTITQAAAQRLVRAQLTSKGFSPIVRSSKPVPLDASPGRPARTMAYDLFLAEPKLSFAAANQGRIGVHLRLDGQLHFASEKLAAKTCTVSIEFDVLAGMRVHDDDEDGTYQLQLDLGVDTIDDVRNWSLKRLRGPNPEPDYLSDLSAELHRMTALSLWIMPFLEDNPLCVTPPGFAELKALGIKPKGPAVATFDGSFSAGLDIDGKTQGDRAALQDLNAIVTAHGWRKTLRQHVQTGTDELGKPLYETRWTDRVRLPTASHATNLAFSVNKAVLEALMPTLRAKVMEGFEDEKKKAIAAAHAYAEAHGKDYDEPVIANITLEKFEVGTADQHLAIWGTASHNGISVDYRLKCALVSTSVDGDGNFVSARQHVIGITADVYDSELDRPWWTTALEVLGLWIGVVLAPFTFGLSLVVVTFVLVAVEPSISNAISGGEAHAKTGVMAALAGNHGRIPLRIPPPNGLPFVLSVDDVVVDPEGVTTWSRIESLAGNLAALALKDGRSTSWPAHDLDPIQVWLHARPGLYHPADLRVRARWEVFGGSTATLLDTRDELIGEPQEYPGPPVSSIAIAHTGPDREIYERFIVKCRIYRPWGSSTDELWSGELVVTIEDRLLHHAPYVRWSTQVYWEQQSSKLGDPTRTSQGWISQQRRSAIHLTSAKDRCRFADRYSPKLRKTDLTYLAKLPFPVAQIQDHREEVCPYCFFGGPDETTLRVTITD